MRRTIALAAAVLTAATFAPSVAEAQYRSTRTITVTPRSYLDPGNVVPVGSLSNYVYVGHYFSEPPYSNQLQVNEERTRYGRAYDLPGRDGFFGPIDFSGRLPR